MRAVLDTNVVVSALLWGGSPAKLADVAQEKRVSLYSSVPLIDELRETLGQAKFGPKLRASGFSLDLLIGRYVDGVELVIPGVVKGIAPDPDDDVVIGTAIAGRADLLVTGDKGLLSVRRYTGGRIVTVTEALAEIGTT
jgi:hypothetical protein